MVRFHWTLAQWTDGQTNCLNAHELCISQCILLASFPSLGFQEVILSSNPKGFDGGKLKQEVILCTEGYRKLTNFTVPDLRGMPKNPKGLGTGLFGFSTE